MLTTPPSLHIWDDFWDFRVADCPCDADFVEWLAADGSVDQTIFHFGTGGHHHVGLAATRLGRGHSVLGITASPQEMEAYQRLVIAEPAASRRYGVLFGDIYLLNPALLPRFDIVTLFHLREFRNDRNDAYGALTDLEMASLLVGQLKPGGRILFFPGSFAWTWEDKGGRQTVAALAEQGLIREAGSFKSLLVYRKI